MRKNVEYCDKPYFAKCGKDGGKVVTIPNYPNPPPPPHPCKGKYFTLLISIVYLYLYFFTFHLTNNLTHRLGGTGNYPFDRNIMIQQKIIMSKLESL